MMNRIDSLNDIDAEYMLYLIANLIECRSQILKLSASVSHSIETRRSRVINDEKFLFVFYDASSFEFSIQISEETLFRSQAKK